MNGQHPHHFIVAENGSSLNKMLRTYPLSRESDEERGISGLDKVASKAVDTAKLKTWMRKEKTVDEVWKKLRLDESLNDAIANPSMNILVKYVNMFNKVNKKNPDKHLSVIKTLSSRYGEDTVAMAFLKATEDKSTNAIATRLLNQQQWGWLTSGKSADDVFKILKVSDDGSEFIGGRKYTLLAEYVALLVANKPAQKVNMFMTLKNGFGGDGKFAVVVLEAMKNPLTRDDGMYWMGPLFNKWLRQDIHPSSFLTRVFKIEEKNLASASTQEKLLAEKYKLYYEMELGIDQIPSVIRPRRS
ncbi:RxLR effector protein [Phytophthora megakarya]|uniref:RxLR effector protein n=1 Tax=Phytophthora megakarya TaxID=4795 RepID=A0A225WRB2_9STRA|nr:RxLR effector protein [Phytophthora megakarya]